MRKKLGKWKKPTRVKRRYRRYLAQIQVRAMPFYFSNKRIEGDCPLAAR